MHSGDPTHSVQVLQNHRDTRGCSFLQPCGGYRSWCRKEETASLPLHHGEGGDTCHGIRITGSRGDLKLPFGPACTWAVEGGRPGARGLPGQTGREGLAKQRACRRQGPAYRRREGKMKLVTTGMKERGPGSAAACVPPPDSSPSKVFLPPAHLGPAVQPSSLLGTEVQVHSLHGACEHASPRKGTPVPWDFPPGPSPSGLTSSQPPVTSKGR